MARACRLLLTLSTVWQMAEAVLEALKKIGSAGYGSAIEGGAMAVHKCTRIADFAELLALVQKVVDVADAVTLEKKFAPYQGT